MYIQDAISTEEKILLLLAFLWYIIKKQAIVGIYRIGHYIKDRKEKYAENRIGGVIRQLDSDNDL